MSQQTTSWVDEVEAYSLMLEKTGALDDLYVTSGPRLFMVGDQHGTFPPLGFHIPGDMGGVWTHPIKLLDGFWLKLTGAAGEFWLEKADKFVVGPGFCEHVYNVAAMGVTVTRREWVPDEIPALVVEYSVKNLRDVEIPLEVQLLVHVNLRPTWRAEEVGMRDAEDELTYLEELNAICGEDTINGWAVVFGTDRSPNYYLMGREVEGRQDSGGQFGGGGDFHYSLDLPSRGTTFVRFFTVGSTESAAAARATYEDLQANHPLYFEEKMARYADAANRSRLQTPDPVINEAFLWAKLEYQLLYAETPVGNGLLSGFPEVPWFNGADICTAVPAALAAGRPEMVKASLALLGDFAKKWHDSQEIPHEITTVGAPYQRTSQISLPLFVIALDQYVRWTGDRNFAAPHMPMAQLLIKRVVDNKRGLNIAPRGPGLIEKPGLAHRMVDTSCLLYEGLRALESLCGAFGDATYGNIARRKAEEVGIMIGSAFWLPDNGLFADMCSPVADITKILDGTAKRLKLANADPLKAHLPAERLVLGSEEAVPEGVMYGWVGRHWISVYPLLVGVANWQQSQTAFPKLESGFFLAPYGVMCQGGIDKKVHPLGTGALACAQLRYGRGDQGVQTVKRMALSLKHEMPGAFAEYLPDQGCCIRGWHGMGLIWSMVHYVMGIRPNLGQRAIDFMPRLPDSWTEAAIDNVHIGELRASFRVVKGERFQESTIALDTHGFQTYFAHPIPHTGEVGVSINGRLQRRWDTEERKLTAGMRWVGAKVDLVPGLNTVRVDW